MEAKPNYPTSIMQYGILNRNILCKYKGIVARIIYYNLLAPLPRGHPASEK